MAVAVLAAVATGTLAAPASAADQIDPGVETRALLDARDDAGRLNVNVYGPNQCVKLGQVTSPLGAAGILADPALSGLLLQAAAGTVTAGRVETVGGASAYVADVLSCDLVARPPIRVIGGVDLEVAPGVSWSIDGEPLESFEGWASADMQVSGTYVVRAHPTTDVPLGGQTEWTYVHDDRAIRTYVEVVDPVPVDGPGTADTITIPNDVWGVTFEINGQTAAAGVHEVTAARDAAGRATVRVTTRVQPGYYPVDIDKFGPWDLRFTTGTVQAGGTAPAAVRPTQISGDGPEDYFTLADLEGIDYVIDGAVRLPGTYRMIDLRKRDGRPQVDIEVHAEDGYHLGQLPQSLTLSSDPRYLADSLRVPTHVDADGRVDDTFTLPEVRGVRYLVDLAGILTPIEPGTHHAWEYNSDPNDPYVYIFPRAEDGFYLRYEQSAMSFNMGFTGEGIPTEDPGYAVYNDELGFENDTFTFTVVEGLRYLYRDGDDWVQFDPGSGTVSVLDLGASLENPQVEYKIRPELGYEWPRNEQGWLYEPAALHQLNVSETTEPDNREPGRPEPPVYTDEPGLDGDTVIIPDVEGIGYYFFSLVPEAHWEYLWPGIYSVTDIVLDDANLEIVIGAAPQPGYLWPSDTEGLPEDLTWVLEVNAEGTPEPEEPDTPTTPTEPTAPTAPAPEPEFGFFLNDAWSAKANHVFSYGRHTDRVLVGDWDGDGVDTIMVRRGNLYYVNNVLGGGQAEHVFAYGRADDTVLVGDWDGDGIDTLAVRRGSVYHLKNDTSTGVADAVVVYGRIDDTVLVGDWDADRVDTLAVRRGSVYHVKNTLSSGVADQVVMYGRAEDQVIVGDWDGDHEDTLTVRRGNVYHVKNSLSGGPADLVLAYGRATDVVLVGDWNDDGTDTLGVRRLP
ncbi:hypothetical protein GCM10022262_12670 [Georgenia daeguensis]|uniref:VCBS repeat-containing protein n=1 Tax=Georgenia daeguensis TaxID=908355 RepID=A0ABP8ESF0_9MICO